MLERKEEEEHLEGHTGAIRAVAVSPDSRFIISGSGDKPLGSGIFKQGGKRGY